MTQRGSDKDAQLGRIFDALKVTPKRLLDFQQNVGRDAVFTVADKIDPDLIPPSQIPRPFTWLWRINLDTFDQGLRTTLDPLGVGYCYMIKRKASSSISVRLAGRSFLMTAPSAGALTSR
jgi:hypothetical protein